MKSLIFFLFISLCITSTLGQPGFKIGRLKYEGGGDWYNDKSSELNLLDFVKKNTSIKIEQGHNFVEIQSPDIFQYSFLFMTGHGNVVFSKRDAENLKNYLENGGFLYIDDDYGLDKALKREMKKVFAENEFVEIPFNHGIYNILYKFENGPPKIHEHDNKQPRGYGLFINGRLAVYYTVESNPADGWADKEVHNDNSEIREKALKFGANIIIWALTN